MKSGRGNGAQARGRRDAGSAAGWTRRELLAAGAAATAVLLVSPRAGRAGGVKVRFLDQIDRVRMEVGGVSPYDLETLDSWITPTKDFFVRNHFGVPRIGDGHLEVSGRIAKAGTWAFEKIRALPRHETVVTLECAGNSVAQGNGLLSNARWTGARLRDLLERVEPTSEDDEIVFTGADAPFEHGERYARSMTVRDALRQEALLVWEMNGEPLPRSHGAPLRLIVPGWYGMASVKWLTSIELRKEPFTGRYQKAWYVNPVLQPDGSVKKEPVTGMRLKSIVARAESKGEVVRVHGAAWSGGEAVERVEVTFDGGTTWTKAVLGDDRAPAAWRLWQADWTPPAPGQYVLASRAWGAGGAVQPLGRPAELEHAPYARDEVVGRALLVEG